MFVVVAMVYVLQDRKAANVQITIPEQSKNF